MSNTPLRFRARNSLRHGFALVYAMLFSVAFILFFTAWTFGARDTLRAVTYSEERVRARALADMGNELAFHLLRARDEDWLPSGTLTFTNRASDGARYLPGLPAAFRSRFDSEAVGGVFEVTISDSKDTDAVGVSVPDGGTYLYIQSTGIVGLAQGSASTSSQMLVKMGSPFVNNVVCAPRGAFVGGGLNFTGPVFINDEPPSSGEMSITANSLDASNPANVRLSKNTAKLGGQVRARGQILLANIVTRGGANPYLESETIPVPAGVHPAGSEMLYPPPNMPIAGVNEPEGIGGIRFTRETIIEPFVELGIEGTPANEIFPNIARVDSRHEVVDITSKTEGVLVEVDGANVSLYEASRQPFGKVYDQGLLFTLLDKGLFQHKRTMVAFEEYYGLLPSRRALLAEVAWNDPAFADAAVPLSLRTQLASDLALPLADIPEEGDFFTLHSVERGALIGNFTLEDAAWTLLDVRSNALSARTEDGRPAAPPLFVRGRVDGKLMLSYSIPESLIEGRDQLDKRALCDIVVLTQVGSSGVPGGLELANPAVQGDPEESGSFTDDYCLLLSRGTVTAAGPLLGQLGWVCQFADPGVRINLLGQALAGADDEQKERVENYHFLAPKTTAGLVGGLMGYNPDVGYSAEMRSLRAESGSASKALKIPIAGPLPTWRAFDPAIGAAVNLDSVPTIPYSLRRAYRPQGVSWWNTGAVAAFDDEGGGYTPIGALHYDYRWRNLSAETLRKNLGLPIQPLMIYRKTNF